jgi:superfamily II DNA/RNA helicase
MPPTPTRDELASLYLDQLPYAPYPVQENALLAWFTAEQGVLVCAPTGMGKTLIAQAALFEALHNRTRAYYTTPLIALTEQKFREMQDAAVRWGFYPDDVGLVTGNRRVNPNARILIVVAEILLNRLLQVGTTPGADTEEIDSRAFDFSDVSAVVMDEFHNFADPERGIVWELSLGMLPAHVRLLLLSATVGNANEFLAWLERCHGRKVELVESRERKVPLTFRWVPDEFLGDQLVHMAKGQGEERTTPTLVFCFNRDECWSVAEMLKGLDLFQPGVRPRLNAEVDKLDWKRGVGPKLKQMLRRGVGVHHAGLLPMYRRVVEDLFVRKLLTVVVCTETLAAGINLPARSVLMTRLVKGPPGKERLIDASSAHQIFGRAGRPQFDDRGFVYALSHEDDVRILRWREKYDAIPENTKDPALLKAKKALKRKKPSRREGAVYWSESQFQQLQAAPPGKLYSKGPFPWRLLAYMLKVSPELSRVRSAIRKRLMDEARVRASEKTLDRMLLTLHHKGFVVLDPEPPPPASAEEGENSPASAASDGTPSPAEPYQAVRALPTERLDTLLVFRSIHPLYGAYLLEHLGIASREERLQALESVLEVPRSVFRQVRVPLPGDRPGGPEPLLPGPLATTRLDPELVRRGLVRASLLSENEEPEPERGRWSWEERERMPALAEKLLMYFEATHPEVHDVNISPVWVAGELLRFGDDFDLYVRSRDLVKQEGIIFRHLLRLILLCGEFQQVCPADVSPEEWQEELRTLADQLTASCRRIDPTSTDEMISMASAAADFVGESKSLSLPSPLKPGEPTPGEQEITPSEERTFGQGVFDEE